MLTDVRKRFFIAGFAAAGWAAIGGCGSPSPSREPYTELSCEQLTAEYDRVNRGRAIGTIAELSGAAQGVIAASPKEGATAIGIDRAMSMSEASDRMELLRKIYSEKECAPGVGTGKNK